MYKIAAVGERDSIYGFASIGLSIFPVDEASEAIRTVKSLANNDFAVIYITESIAQKIEQELLVYSAQPLPAIILIPGVTGSSGLGMKNVSKSVEQAVGSDIIN